MRSGKFVIDRCLDFGFSPWSQSRYTVHRKFGPDFLPPGDHESFGAQRDFDVHSYLDNMDLFAFD